MSVEVKFDNLHNEIQRELKKSNESVLIAVAWITFRLYADIFKELINKGVKIEILCTNSSPNKKQIKIIEKLRSYGIEIRLCEMPTYTNHMHHKFAVIDNSVILNGSFNWSENAKKSFENLTIIKNETEIVNLFNQEFEKIKILDRKAIKSLQAKEKCKEKFCDGELANILIFQSSPLEMTYEIWGDVIRCCSVCGEDSYTTVVSGVQDTGLYSFFMKDELDLDEEGSILFDQEKDLYLIGYSQHGVVIHGIGFTCRELWGKNEESVFTKIVWKNKFVANAVRHRYESDFGVVYE